MISVNSAGRTLRADLATPHRLNRLALHHPMPLHVCEPGEWYLVVTCRGCQTRGPLVHDLSQGRAEIVAVYTWRCPVCDHIDQYDVDDIERYRHPLRNEAES